MKCNHCGKEAMIELRFIHSDGEEKVLHLCHECMSKLFMENMVADDFKFFQEVLEKLLGSILSSKETSVEEEEEDENAPRCPYCNTGFAGIRRNGKFGCDRCYETFKEEVGDVISACQGSLHHRGRVPKEYGDILEIMQQIEKKKEEIQKDILEENYEHAATVRDEIVALQKEVDKKRGEADAKLER